MMTYFWYILGATFIIISASAPSRYIITSLSVSVWRYTPGISKVAMSQPSCDSTATVINTDYVANVGEATSSLFIFSHCFVKSEHERPFMSPLNFPFRNINDATTPDLCFLVILVVFTGSKVSRTFSCVSYFVNDASRSSLNFLSPFLVHVVTRWCGACGFNFNPKSCVCSGVCIHCCEFYLIGWILFWSLVSCIWLYILHSVLLMGILPPQLWYPHHICPHHCFILILGMVCLLLPWLHHCHHNNTPHHYHPHCNYFHNQVKTQMLGWL